MSQPGQPSPQPPLGYGGYGGELQHYQAQGHPPSYPPPNFAPGQPPPGHPSPLQPPPGYPGAGQSPPGYPASTAPQPWAQPPVSSPGVARPPQRPVAVGLAATLAVTASLEFIGALSLLWLIAVTGNEQLGTSGPDGVLYHILNRFDDRMVTGLAWPLYLFPLAAIVLGLLLPARRPWARLAFTLLGGATVAWLAWWFRSDLRWLIVPGTYIAFCVGILWTSAVSRWYRWRPGSDGHPQSS